jgi:predicted nucleic acid-binding protein
MFKFRIYIDTSVIGGSYDSEFEEWSKKLMTEFKRGNRIAVISDITLNELEEAPENVRKIIETIPEENLEMLIKDDEVDFLADLYLNEGAITRKHYEDAMHIALATINKVDVLVSWNFKHIVNINRIRKYNAVNLKYGYQTLEIRSPREVLDEDEE